MWQEGTPRLPSCLSIDFQGNSMFRRVAKGFTLVELMIVVAIIAILSSLAYYNYSRYAFRTRRADGREMLMRVAAAQERYLTNCNRYAPTITGTDTPCNAATGSLAFASNASDKGYYTINAPTIANGGSTYILVAVPASTQVGDTCGNLRLTSAGFKDQTGSNTANGSCW
jgi:type IV pilus assembly protein PilE